jgi:hypothetical protein
MSKLEARRLNKVVTAVLTTATQPGKPLTVATFADVKSRLPQTCYKYVDIPRLRLRVEEALLTKQFPAAQVTSEPTHMPATVAEASRYTRPFTHSVGWFVVNSVDAVIYVAAQDVRGLSGNAKKEKREANINRAALTGKVSRAALAGSEILQLNK